MAKQTDPLGAGEISAAIQACNDNIKSHRKAARFTLVSLVIVLFGLSSLLLGIAYFSSLGSYPYSFRIAETKEMKDAVLKAETERVKAQTERATVTNYVILALCVLVFGVLMAVYRFHLTEISKVEHYMIGFIRIQIAAHNSSTGYQTDVRRALTDAAFDYTKPPLGPGGKKRIESPLPGHPTTDVATLVLNQILDQIEIHTKARQKPIRSGNDKA